jgi:hypothetical protein
MMNHPTATAVSASDTESPFTSKVCVMFVDLDCTCIDNSDATTPRHDVAARLPIIAQRMRTRFAHFLSAQNANIAFGPVGADVAITNLAKPPAMRTTNFAWSHITQNVIDQCHWFKEKCERNGVTLSDHTLVFVASVAVPEQVIIHTTIEMVNYAKVKSLENHPHVAMNVSVNFLAFE